jgi:hypothetical protein
MGGHLAHAEPAALAAAVTLMADQDTLVMHERVQYGAGLVCGNRAENVGIVRKPCRGGGNAAVHVSVMNAHDWSWATSKAGQLVGSRCFVVASVPSSA